MVNRYVLELSTNSHSERTVNEYAKTIRRWQRSGLPPVDYLAGMKVKVSSRAKEGIVLRRYLAWAVTHGFESENPLACIRFHAPPAPCVRPFSRDEIRSLEAGARTDLERAVILSLSKLGLRASELCGIEPADLDGDTLLIKGKGGKTRIVATIGLVEALRTICEAHLNYQTLYRRIKAVGRRAHVVHVHPHRFRHTFAHSFLAAGGDIGNLRLILGHTNFAQTAHYARFYEQERAIEAHRRFLES